MSKPLLRPIRCSRLPSGVAPKLVFPKEGLVDNGHFRRALGVARQEFAAGHEIDAKRAEIVRARRSCNTRSSSSFRTVGDALQPEIAHGGGSRNQSNARGRDADDTRVCGQLAPESRRAPDATARTAYPFIAGDTPNTTSCSVFRPRSTRATFSRLFVNRPAEISSAIDSAICAVASVRRKRAAAFAPDG